MSEEVMTIRLMTGISCKDGRKFMELICSDVNNKEVRIILPSEGECERDHCEECSIHDTCKILIPFGVELGRKLIIKRFE